MERRCVSAREIVGKKIVRFEPRTFSDQRGGTAHDPVIVLDDGSFLTFITEETETGDYGVFILRHKPAVKPRKPKRSRAACDYSEGRR